MKRLALFLALSAVPCLGQPSYHTQYQTYATSSTAGTGAGSEYKSIYSLGWAQTGPTCGNGTAQTNEIHATLK